MKYLIFLLACLAQDKLLKNFRKLETSTAYNEFKNYYSRDNCISKGYMPNWSDPNYSPTTYFEKVFKSPLTIDWIASGLSGQEAGFEQVTADWGCDFSSTYGTGTNDIGFFGPGAKDPSGGGCPKGPIKVYEDLACAIQLGFPDEPDAFKKFCSDEVSTEQGMFECIGFFAHVLTETGAFAETEERDPRTYCWDKDSADCCPDSSTVKCNEGQDSVSSGDFPPANKYLTDAEVDNKCCSYHGRGFLQVSYEPNYKKLSYKMTKDEMLFVKKPHLLRSDGIEGWVAALWYWFSPHEAQVVEKYGDEPRNTSPREELLNWEKGFGMPASILMINGAECNGTIDTTKSKQRVGMLFSIANRLGAKPPTASGETPLDYYPLPGTTDCAKSKWCSAQFMNSDSVCSIFRNGFSCVVEEPYLYNVSTPMGFDRKVVRLNNKDTAMPMCDFQSTNKDTPAIWKKKYKEEKVPANWHKMLDFTTENICDHAKLMYKDSSGKITEGTSSVCNKYCWRDYTTDYSQKGRGCPDAEQPPTPCKTLATYVARPIPFNTAEKGGDLSDYLGGRIMGRVGPGLFQAINEQAFGDANDYLCYVYGGSQCSWNIASAGDRTDENDIHNCRVYLGDETDNAVMDGIFNKDIWWALEQGDIPEIMKKILAYWDKSNCPKLNNDTIIEKILPKGHFHFDYLFSGHYSANDGFANKRFDNFDDIYVNNENVAYGKFGPLNTYEAFMCAYNLGLPDDPDYFKRKLFKRSESLSDTYTDEDIQFAKFEFVSLMANVMQETGAMGQFEEQASTTYCYNNGGIDYKCCENYWDNNKPCGTTAGTKGLLTNATCCTYHGRGPLQVSYELNYGKVGEKMFGSTMFGTTEEYGRKLLLNYPQVIDSFGITGWVSSFIFWLQGNPCAYCEGKKAEAVDTSKTYSPHDAIVNYETPGEGFLKTIVIINGALCEAQLTEESVNGKFDAQTRLALFYNLVNRLNVTGVGEDNIIPLPGTKECDESKLCKNMYAPHDNAPFGRRASACWVLTPQIVGDKELWPYCHINSTDLVVISKYGAQIRNANLNMKKYENDCTTEVSQNCGAKLIDPNNKPSMYEENNLKYYTQQLEWPDSFYGQKDFMEYYNMTHDELCKLNNNALPPQNNGLDCEGFCNQYLVSYCAALDPTTCIFGAKGLAFIDCNNRYYTGVGASSNWAKCRLEGTSEA